MQLTAYADDLAIHGGPIGEDIVYKQMTTALKKIEAEAMQLGVKFSPEKCEAYGIEVSTQIGTSRSPGQGSHGGHQSSTSGSS